MYAIQLTASGFDVTTAHYGAEALRIAADCLPDLIYLDLGLPGMDGPRGPRAASATAPDHRGSPVVILTNFSEPDMVKRGRNSARRTT